MARGIDWGMWIAICALIVGLARFVDKYHIKTDTQSRMRNWLIYAFVFLDRPHIADFPRVIYGQFGTRLAKFGVLGWVLLCLIGYFVIVSSFYWGRYFFNMHPENSYLSYVLTWTDSPFWVVVILWGLSAGGISLISTSAFLERWNQTNGILMQMAIALLSLISLAMFVLGTGVGFFVIGYFKPDSGMPVISPSAMMVGNPVFLVVLAVVCLWHAIAVVMGIVFSTIVRLPFLLIHKISLLVLDAASSPKVSPFQYLAALIALIVLALKIGVEVAK